MSDAIHRNPAKAHVLPFPLAPGYPVYDGSMQGMRIHPKDDKISATLRLSRRRCLMDWQSDRLVDMLMMHPDPTMERKDPIEERVIMGMYCASLSWTMA